MLRFVYVLFMFLSLQISAAEKITLANGEWAPYLSQELKHYGYLSQIVTEAFAEEGIDVEYAFLPWKRGFEEARQGRHDGSLVWGYNKERAESFLYSDVVAELGTSLFHQKGKVIKIEKPEDLKNYHIGGVIGYAYGVEELEREGNVTIDRIGSDVGNYRKLAAGRLDIVLEDTEAGYCVINKYGLQDKIVASPDILHARNYHLIISKKSPEADKLILAFNKGLKKLKSDGRYQTYLEASRRGEYKQPIYLPDN